jgi:hypothetical protein
VKGYASICKPLHDSIKKNAFAWGEPQQKAFEQLKLAMTTPPVLPLPNFALPFVLETDASGSGLGAVLMQQVSSATMPLNKFGTVSYFHLPLGTDRGGEGKEMVGMLMSISSGAESTCALVRERGAGRRPDSSALSSPSPSGREGVGRRWSVVGRAACSPLFNRGLLCDAALQARLLFPVD